MPYASQSLLPSEAQIRTGSVAAECTNGPRRSGNGAFWNAQETDHLKMKVPIAGDWTDGG